jgi:predicted SprT family Zn-dependent metalloprotease
MENNNTLNSEFYGTLEKAYNFFNKSLFCNSLPPCILTLRPWKTSYGIYNPQYFESRNGSSAISEIALNPNNFPERSDIEILGTMVHEMCHAFQDLVSNTSPKSGGHDKEWADLMESIGLIPSHNGEVGGRKTGKHVTHYIDELGKFHEAASVFLQNNKIEWNGSSNPPEKKERKKRKKTKFKFVCPTCMQEIWGKVGTSVLCGNCKDAMKVDEEEILLNEDED